MTCGESNKADQQPSNKRSSSSPNMDQRSPLEAKRAKIEVTLASSEASQLGQIESEFQILKSLIPDIANRQQINELEIIDACVNYIATLQTQLNVVSTEDEEVQDL